MNKIRARRMTKSSFYAQRHKAPARTEGVNIGGAAIKFENAQKESTFKVEPIVAL